MTTRVRRLAAAAAATALLGLGAAGCSSTSAGDNDDSGANGGSQGDTNDEAVASEVAGSTARRSALDAPVGAADAAADTAADPVRAVEPGEPRSLIKEGNVALRSGNVDDTLFDIRQVLHRTRGEIAEDSTEADDQGVTKRALLTVRVPADRFETALQDLKTLGTAEEGVDLVDSSSTTTDVSTQVIDTDVRVELQKRSIERISVLLDRAGSIRDIVGIERELARREADLGSLQKRQAFLADQTSLSTITLSVERPRAKTAKEGEKREDDGFAAGLDNGWEAFKDVTTGLLTAAGAVLPFALLALVIGVPLRLWLRRRQASPAVRPPETATPAGA